MASGSGERCDGVRLVDAHFAGRLDPSGERHLRAHLPDCAECRARYERHLALAALDPQTAPAAERLAGGVGLGRRGSRTGWWVGAPLAAAAAAAVVLLALGGPADDGFTSRGDGAGGSAAVLRVWRIVTPSEPGGPRAPQRLVDGAALRPGDELAFAYENPGARAFLLVYGVDDRGAVYWYHPAWEDAAGSPRAVAIDAGPALHELPEAVRHDLGGARLWIHAVFTDEPLDVRAVEALVATLDDPGAPLPLPDADQRVLSFPVRREGGAR